jgi:hypothetical protein
MKGHLAIGCVLITASCGYPDFAFAPEGDATIDDSAIDSTSEVGIDSTSEVAIDSGRESAIDSSIDAIDSDTALGETAIDSTAETPSDSISEAPTDVLAEAETPDPCAPIDDLEDGDARILVRCGRNGYWFTYDDGTAGATQTPAPSATCLPSLLPIGTPTNLYAMRTYGSGFTTWGAGIGFNFVDGGPSYDASAWGGITFSARVETGTTTAVHFSFPDVDTDARGGVCTGFTPGCGDHFGIDLVLTTTWTTYTIRFSDLRQIGWGHAASAFAPAKVYGVQGGMPASTTFDLWLDEISFVH